MAQKVNKEMLLPEVLAVHPAIAELLMSRGMHCISCFAAEAESLEEALYVHGYAPDEIDEVVDEINDFLVYLEKLENGEVDQYGQPLKDAPQAETAPKAE